MLMMMIDENYAKEYELKHLYRAYLKEETNDSMDDLVDDCPEVVRQQYKERLELIQSYNEKGIPLPEDL